MKLSPTIPLTRTRSREGVNAARALFEAAGCIFQEVAQQNDFGKDAYVDLTESGIVTPFCVAVQIKAGESFRLERGNYFIPVDAHAENWRRSTVPVFGLVYDPSDCLLRWTDLTAYLQEHPRQEGGRIPVPADAVLNEESLGGKFATAVSKYASVGGGGIALQLLSSSELQAAAVFDAWALGRHDARYLILLRRLILDLQPEATRRAIVALSHAAPHPDIFWTKDNWIPPEVEAQVQSSFRWAPEEIAHMISAVEDWGRGTVGQSFDVLMYEDPDILPKLHASAGLLLRAGEVTASVHAAALALSHSRDAPRELSALIEDFPKLLADDWFQDLKATVDEWGYFSLY